MDKAAIMKINLVQLTLFLLSLALVSSREVGPQIRRPVTMKVIINIKLLTWVWVSDKMNM